VTAKTANGTDATLITMGSQQFNISNSIGRNELELRSAYQFLWRLDDCQQL
jgi:hypothetical protein